ncbi:MAG: hypothetical protein IJB91_00155 [Oscillospiraceae bacterium]|nr:hypothetical protein [Oscillospiraceae bacterium]
MNRYIANLKSFLAEQSPNFGYTDAKSLLDALYYYYTDANPIDGAVIRCQFQNLDNALSKLSWADCEQVYSHTVDLCISHSRQAFCAGVQIGMRLFTELQNP